MSLSPTQSQGFAQAYGVHLLYAERPIINKAALLESLYARCPGMTVFDGDTQDGLLVFQAAGDREQALRGEWLIAPATPDEIVEAEETSLTQSWHWPDADEAVAECQTSVLVTDLLATGLPHRARLQLFQQVLSAVLERVPCRAIYWRPAGHYIDPVAFLQHMHEAGTSQPLPGAVNVRRFRIAGSDDKLMDTQGLAALGLRDLQCRFQRQHPEAVRRMLYNLALRLFEQGAVIADGDAVQGLDPRDQWRSRHAQSLIGPSRPVIDIDLGERP